jgi:uracil-DNA glycosylase
MVKFGNDWDDILKGEFEKEYYVRLHNFLKSEYSHHIVYPDMYDIFNALKYTPYEKTKVVILGQDPYHEPGQAHGLAFSVEKGTALPPSLLNIYKEIEDEFSIEMPRDYGTLTKWAKQGVLLLNTTLTVRAHMANSHQNAGWSIFTDTVIKKLNERKTPIVFMLWGANAKKKREFVDNPIHLVLKTSHPSPLSVHRGFSGCGHFKICNEFIEKNGGTPIDWSISKENNDIY